MLIPLDNSHTLYLIQSIFFTAIGSREKSTIKSVGHLPPLLTLYFQKKITLHNYGKRRKEQFSTRASLLLLFQDFQGQCGGDKEIAKMHV